MILVTMINICGKGTKRKELRSICFSAFSASGRKKNGNLWTAINR
ncbi:hypothetical protein HMPREF0322_00101 [Desulfitobacterium hafniense DP7]|uniref:Uncharacterized protein n=1 Tax=Desulfitobacterium hafniense DP7 TaxID=537010 RepID=G9XGN5_DESHA|nr:hypothetical protein HMPREF0322_00101 [Desulfitobacterium hafniense DP7]